MSKFQKNYFRQEIVKNAENPVFSAVFAFASASKKTIGKSVNSKIAIYRPFLALVFLELILERVLFSSAAQEADFAMPAVEG